MAISRGLVAAVVTDPNPSLASADPLAVLILGPTGSGKTALSLALGEHFRDTSGPIGEVVSCDSVAVYRGLDIGSAKPTPAERARLSHHLVDVADPDQPFTAGEYSRRARAALAEIAARSHLPLVTGGTGLYLRALTLGLFASPPRQLEMRARLTRSQQRHRPGWLHRMLTSLDPVTAARIHANDTPKLIRALEICFATGQALSETLNASPETARDLLTGFRLLRIGLNPPRAVLYERLNQRAAAMFAADLVEETRALLARFGPVPSLDSLGYRQAQAVLSGAMTESEAIAAAQQGHRNYAKRQLTWFRREPDVYWIEDFGETPAAIEHAVRLVAQSL
jgi:tRNA dimethylallyltransferase